MIRPVEDSLERRDNMICPHVPNSRSPYNLVALVWILQVHEDYQEDLEYESSDSDEAGLGCLGGWVLDFGSATAATQGASTA